MLSKITIISALLKENPERKLFLQNQPVFVLITFGLHKTCYSIPSPQNRINIFSVMSSSNEGETCGTQPNMAQVAQGCCAAMKLKPSADCRAASLMSLCEIRAKFK